MQGILWSLSVVCLWNRSGIRFHQSTFSWWLSLSWDVKRETHQRDASKWDETRRSLPINYRLTLYGGLKLSRPKPWELLQIGLIEKFSKESFQLKSLRCWNKYGISNLWAVRNSTTADLLFEKECHVGKLLCCVAQESQTLNWSTEALLAERKFWISCFLWVATVTIRSVDERVARNELFRRLFLWVSLYLARRWNFENFFHTTNKMAVSKLKTPKVINLRRENIMLSTV